MAAWILGCLGLGVLGWAFFPRSLFRQTIKSIRWIAGQVRHQHRLRAERPKVLEAYTTWNGQRQQVMSQCPPGRHEEWLQIINQIEEGE